MVRLAVAVRPPAEVIARLAAWERAELPGVLWSLPEQWIVKVRPLGHVAEHLVASLLGALDTELDGAPHAACVLGPRTVRLGGQWLGAPVSGLDDLGAAVFDATRELVPVTHPQPFHADLVLARGKVPRELADLPIDAVWTATELLLTADRSAPGRPRFEDLGRIELGR
jgi:2'-5' RNA ligase